MSVIKFIKSFVILASLVLSAAAWAEAPATATTPTTTTPQPAIESVNINTADAATLAEHLKGVGIKRAEAIVAYREQHGAFINKDELMEIKGIGEATLARNAAVIVLE